MLPGQRQRGEVARVSHPRHLQLHGPHSGVPGALAVSVALAHTLGSSLVRCGSYVLLDLHFHERLGEHPDALLEEVRILIDHRLAQQLLESYPQFIGHRCLHSVDWSLLKEPHGGRLRQQPLPFTHLRGHYRRRREEVSNKLTVLVATSRTDASPLSNTVVWFDLTLQPVIGSSPSSAAEESVAGEGDQRHEHDRSERGSKQQYDQEPDQ